MTEDSGELQSVLRVSQHSVQKKCYTQFFENKNVLIAFRVTRKEYEDLVKKAGKGKVSSFIREALGLTEAENNGKIV